MRTLPRFALVATLLLCGCPKRGVLVNGQELSNEEASASADRDLAALRAETSKEPPATAAERFDAFAARYGQLPQAGEALAEAGNRWRAAGRLDRARSDYGELLTRFPLSPHAPEAKLGLALTDLDGGRPRDGLQTLSSVYPALPPERKLEAARAGVRGAEALQAWPDAVRWRAEVAREAPPPDRAKELQAALATAQARLTPAQAQALRKELPPDSPVGPALALQSARGLLQAGDVAGAEAAAREVVDRYPQSPQAGEARAFLDGLAHRAPVNPQVIGVAVPLSGKNKAWGEAILQGVQLALGDGGHYRLAVVDTRGEPDGAQAAVEQLVQKEGAIAALGGVVSAEAPRAAAAAQAQGIPFLSLSRTPAITDAGSFVFRNMLTAEAQANALADLAARRGMKRFGLLWPEIPYGDELAQAFWDQVDARGGEVRAAESYERDRTSFGPLVKGMVGKLWLDERQDYVQGVKDLTERETDPFRRRKALERFRAQLPPIVDFDAVFIPDFAKYVALVAPALAVEDVVTQTCDPREVERLRRMTGREDLQPVQLLGANGWDDPALVEKGGRYVECSIFVDGFYAGSERPATKSFVTAFQQKYDHPPTILEASAFDATGAIKKVLSGGAATRETVRQGLTDLKAYPGATGDLGFDDKREVSKPLFYLTVDKGVVRELTPQEIAATGAAGQG